MLQNRHDDWQYLLQVSETVREMYNEGFEKGVEKGIEKTLLRLFARRVGRAPSQAEEQAIAQRARALGPERAFDAMLDRSGDALTAWLLDPQATGPTNQPP